MPLPTTTRRCAATAVLLTITMVGLSSCGDQADQSALSVTASTSTSALTADDAPAAGAGATDTTTTTTSTAPTTSTTLAPAVPATATNLTAPRTAAPVVLPTEPGLAPVVSRVPTTDRVIFLTIDDGIWRVPGVAEKLRELGIPFASFLTQPYARADVAYWRRSLELGGTVQSHTTNHPDLRRTNAQRTILEVCSTRQPYQELFGQTQDLFRPPYGNVTEMVRRAAAGCGFRAVVLWKGVLDNGVLTLQDGRLSPGDIILMHYQPEAFADIQAVALTALAQGFTFGRLEDYLVGPAPS